MLITHVDIYFWIVFGTHIYAYYLYNHIWETYKNSNTKCDDLPNSNVVFFPIFTSTMMFLTNIMCYRTIVNYLKASFECRKLGSWDNFPLGYFTKCSDCKLFLLHILSFYIGSTIIISNVVIFRNHCFKHNFVQENRQYQIITCVLSILWFFSISMFWGMSKFSKDNVPMYYLVSDCYKNISDVRKLIFTLGVVVSHGVSLYLFPNGNNGEAMRYVQAIFWIGNVSDMLNLFTLWYNDYADITLCAFTTCGTVINCVLSSFVIGLEDKQIFSTIFLLLLSNIFSGIYIGAGLIVLYKIVFALCVIGLMVLIFCIPFVVLIIFPFVYLLYKIIFEGICSHENDGSFDSCTNNLWLEIMDTVDLYSGHCWNLIVYVLFGKNYMLEQGVCTCSRTHTCPLHTQNIMGKTNITQNILDQTNDSTV